MLFNASLVAPHLDRDSLYPRAMAEECSGLHSYICSSDFNLYNNGVDIVNIDYFDAGYGKYTYLSNCGGGAKC